MPKSKIQHDILLVTENQYLSVLIPLLEGARQSIDILAFSFAVGTGRESAPREIAEKIISLKKKNRKKLRVRLYIEGERETSDRNRVTAEMLKAAGVEVHFGATHAKGFCIDDRYLLLGSTNLTHQSLTKNNETNVLIDSAEISKEFLRYFEHLWDGGRHGEMKLESPFFADGDFKDQLISVIDEAKKQIEFSIYFFNHLEIEQALIRAFKRKVKIRGFVHDHRSFAMSYVRRSRATVERLRLAGLTDLHFAAPTHFTHSKYLIKDRAEIMIGTGNWLVEDVEIHPQLYLHLKDKALSAQLAKHLQRQIKSEATD